MTASGLSVGLIAEAIGAQIEGDAKAAITGAAAIDTAVAGDITFVVDGRRARQLPECRATAVVAGAGVEVPAGMAVLRVVDVQSAFSKVLALLADPEDLPPEGVHPSAVVDATALLGSGVAVGPHAVVGAGATLGDNVVVCANVYVGADAVIGEGSVLMPGVVVSRRCRIGRRCRLHANAVIGADGFGYYFRDGAHHKIPHIGTVEIGDDVEIGACSCVDRAKFGATRIGDGTKIDNLVQIAHNVQIGKGVILAGLVGVAGSSKLGDYVVLGGHAGIRDNITVGDEVRVAAYSAVLQDVPPGQTIGGIPAFDERQCVRVYHLQQKLPDLKKQLEQLQARVNGLENATKDHRP